MSQSKCNGTSKTNQVIVCICSFSHSSLLKTTSPRCWGRAVPRLHFCRSAHVLTNCVERSLLGWEQSWLYSLWLPHPPQPAPDRLTSSSACYESSLLACYMSCGNDQWRTKLSTDLNTFPPHFLSHWLSVSSLAFILLCKSTMCEDTTN